MKNLLKNYRNKKEEIRNKLKEFSKIKNDDIFYELCFCLLTPQSKAKSCWEAIKTLRRKDFLNKKINPLPIIKEKTRFHNNKSKYLLEAKEKYPGLLVSLNKNNDLQMRLWLIENIKGLGLKEASHFLRNIGKRDLAILDRHILTNLKRYNIINKIPKLTKSNYFKIEDKFKQFSKRIKIPIDELDLLFWSLEGGTIFK